MTYAELLDQLTLDEKIGLLDGADLWRTKPVERLGIPSVMLSDGPHGLRVQYDEGDHLGREGSEPATCFPPAVAIAASWNRDLARSVGAALADEARAAGVSVVLGPGLNLKRTPLCGRNLEYYSEDPLLSGELAGHLAAGIQSRGVGATLKHFAANNQETERMSISVDADERTLRELYLAGFERAVAVARPWAVMCSYNRINGVFASEDPWLLTDVLREQWGFDGLVVSDWGAVSRRDRAVAAGLDLEMPSSSGIGSATIAAALRSGTLSEEDLDAAVRRVLELVDRSTRAVAEIAVEPLDERRQRDVAYRAALEGVVLLRNDGVLPLDPDTGGAVAVIGELARTPRSQGAGSSKVNSRHVEAALPALEHALRARGVAYAPGYRLDGRADDPLVAEAVEAAASAEIAVVFLGIPEQAESESFDRADLDLPPDQLALLRRVRAVNDRVVVVLSNGGVVLTGGWSESVAAVLETWLLGDAGGAAIAALLTGAESPSGRLAETIPLSARHAPAVGNYPGEFGQVHYGERLLVGYRWYDTHELPVAYAFGHGLTYTTFEYRDVRVEVDADGAGAASVLVVNIGPRAAAEVVQLYVQDASATVDRPEHELKAFSKVRLEPGESARVVLPLDHRSWAFWHAGVAAWIVEEGEFEVRIGASSRDIRHRTRVHLRGDTVRMPLTLDSPTGQWWTDPVIGAQVRSEITGRYGRLLDDPIESPLFRPIPLSRMMRFPGFSLTEERARELLARSRADGASAAG